MKKRFMTMILLSLMATTAVTANTVDIIRKVREYIKVEYKNAVIIETEREHGNIEMEIIHNGKEKTLIFDEKGVWQSTKYDLNRSELPLKVKTGLDKSQFSSYRIKDIEIIQTPTKVLYEIELGKMFSDDITVYATPEGELL